MADESTYDLDGTRTPQALFDSIAKKYRIIWDLFASEENAKAPGFFSKNRSAWEDDWPLMHTTLLPGGIASPGWCFGNPPYSRGNLPRYVAKCLEQVKRGCAIVSLIPATPGTKWFNEDILRRCDTLEGYTVDEGPIVGYCLSMQGINYRQTVTFLQGRVPFDKPVGYPPDKPWDPPATDSILWAIRPPLR